MTAPGDPDPARPASADRGFGWLCLGYAAVMLYGSTVIGPSGINFVPRNPAAAFQQFLATRFVAHGSDQRADWIGNLLMLVPFGFLVAGALLPRRPVLRPPALIAALLVCLLTILVIKYLQLFFPPRTVTLNYITAQAAGATIGCIAFAVWQQRLATAVTGPDPIAMLVLALRLYFGALLIFLLMPLDFALNPDDLWMQAQRLPDAALALPGQGRPLPIRIIVIATAAAAFVPVGMLLVFTGTGRNQVRRSLPRIAVIGFAINIAIFAASALVMGANPRMSAILYRTAGIVSGAAILRWLGGQNINELHRRLTRLVPWLIPLYLIAVLLVNRVASPHWLTPNQAAQQFYPLGVLPLFDYYIVSKAAAAKNIVGHALAYMPVGAALWLRDGRQRTGQAFVLAALLSAGIEAARYFRPGLEGDINAVVVGGLSAALTMRLMPGIWAMLAMLARQPEPVSRIHWNPAEPAGLHDHLSRPSAAEVEEY